MGVTQRETVKLSKGALKKAPKVTMEEFISSSKKLGKRPVPTTGFMGKDVSIAEVRGGALKISRKAQVIDLTPTRKVLSGRLYSSKGVGTGEVSKAKLLINKGARKIKDIGYISEGGKSQVTKVVTKQIEKTPFSQVFKETKKVTKIIPEVKVVQEVTTSITPVVVESKYAGTGLYERTEEYAFGQGRLSVKPQTQLELFTSPVKEISSGERGVLGAGLKLIPRQETSTESIIKQVKKSQPMEKVMERIDIKPVSKVIERIGGSEIFKQKVAQTQKIESAQIIKLDQVQRFKQRITPQHSTERINKITETIKIKIPQPTQQQTAGLSTQTKQRVGDLFKVFARKGGIDIEIGGAKTERQAFLKLKQKLKGTLRASGFVTKGGEKVKPLEFGEEYRIGKSDPFRIVQKKGKRFGTKKETSEAQYFRKSKGGNLFGSKKKRSKKNSFI